MKINVLLGKAYLKDNRDQAPCPTEHCTILVTPNLSINVTERLFIGSKIVKRSVRRQMHDQI